MPAPLNWTDIGKPPEGFGFVYSLCDPGNPSVPRYIGQTTTSMARRLISHKHDTKRRPDIPASVWLKSLIDSGRHPIARVMEIVPKDCLNQREEAWILFFKPLSVLTNKSNGQGMKGLKGYVSPLNRQITAERNRRGWTEQMREKIIRANKGKIMPEAQRLAMLSSDSHKERMDKFVQANERRKKRVVCMETGEKFDSIRGCARAMGCSQSQLKHALKNNWKLRGRKWEVVPQTNHSYV